MLISHNHTKQISSLSIRKKREVAHGRWFWWHLLTSQLHVPRSLVAVLQISTAVSPVTFHERNGACKWDWLEDDLEKMKPQSLLPTLEFNILGVSWCIFHSSFVWKMFSWFLYRSVFCWLNNEISSLVTRTSTLNVRERAYPAFPRRSLNSWAASHWLPVNQ